MLILATTVTMIAATVKMKHQPNIKFLRVIGVHCPRMLYHVKVVGYGFVTDAKHRVGHMVLIALASVQVTSFQAIHSLLLK